MCIAYPSFNKALSSVKQTTSFCDSAYGRQLAQCFTKKNFWADKPIYAVPFLRTLVFARKMF
ncbi:hypothetical protein DKE41_001700 [Acinetobacter pittii]|nr:hypothetical protein DKP84_01875 [Acinetobacter pittii]AZB89963.1 hypothetical protein DKE41_001700 [Acinetobacter pittii]